MKMKLNTCRITINFFTTDRAYQLSCFPTCMTSHLSWSCTGSLSSDRRRRVPWVSYPGKRRAGRRWGRHVNPTHKVMRWIPPTPIIIADINLSSFPFYVCVIICAYRHLTPVETLAECIYSSTYRRIISLRCYEEMHKSNIINLNESFLAPCIGEAFCLLAPCNRKQPLRHRAWGKYKTGPTRWLPKKLFTLLSSRNCDSK